MLIIIRISNVKINELTIETILCRNVAIFYRKKTSFFVSSAGKIESMQEEFEMKLFQ